MGEERKQIKIYCIGEIQFKKVLGGYTTLSGFASCLLQRHGFGPQHCKTSKLNGNCVSDIPTCVAGSVRCANGLSVLKMTTVLFFLNFEYGF